MEATERGSRGSLAPFVVFAVLGVPAMFVVWTWYGLSFFEEMTEQPKALAAGTTMEGQGMLFGLPPLIVAHVVGLLVLGGFARRAARPGRRAMVWAVIAVAAASVAGILLAQLVWEGRLFEMGANSPPPYVP
ncbi:hypothetical protein [Microbacterium sp. No. 7]|uniref:hypothetical protein n=1 Tax=Microbacterium sp. No. 7 TaxID=1714373 RepID=UPI0006D0F268|nr:hypothetical protein [Microbacterium sp. No. 7]ALJ20461.1 hypothetical protein AOA12_11300 [Microbacterium sp. No. 7]